MARRKTAQEKKLDALLSKFEPEVQKAFIAAIQAQRQSIELTALIDAIENGQIERAVNLFRSKQQLLFPLTEAVRGSYIAGGSSVAAALPLKIRAQYGFGGNQRAVEAVERITGTLIQGVQDDTLSMVRDLITTGVNDGIPPRKQALDIVGRVRKGSRVRQGGFLGLDSERIRQSERVSEMLRDPDMIKDYFKGSKPRYKHTPRALDGKVRKAIAEGRALDLKYIREIETRHKARLLKSRGETIARTETLNALRAGQHDGYATLIDSGMVAADQMTVKWLATSDGRTRDSHTSLNGTVIQFGELFESDTGGRMAHPGDTSHGASGEDVIQCRCVPIYRIKSKVDR